MSVGRGVVKRPLLGGAENYNNSYGRRPGQTTQPYQVLLFKIIKPNKPVDTSILNTICKPHGQVIRIVIFRTNGVEAMVDIETARKVKDALNGEDIYSGCCTLKIEFAKPQLTVLRNDSESWDYTNPNLPAKQESEPRAKKPLIQELPNFGGPPGLPPSFPPLHGLRPPFPPPFPPRRGYEETGYMDYGRTDFREYERPGYRDYERPGYSDYDDASYGDYDDRSLNGAHEGVTPVFMVYKLDPIEATPDRLFNIFCLYGNVIRIKFIKSKDDTAMVEMGNSASAEQVVKYLQGISVFGKQLKLWYSKKFFLTMPESETPLLANGKPAIQDFTKSKDNRFKNPDIPSKYPMKFPTKILHFFNAPLDVTKEQILKIFEDMSQTVPFVKKPNVTIFERKGLAKFSNGTLEFEEVVDSLNALAYCNHAAIGDPESGKLSKLKLCWYRSV